MEIDNHIEELIARVLSLEANAGEIAQLEVWKNASEENRHYYDSLERIYSMTGDVKNASDFNTDAAFEKVKNRIAASGQSMPSMQVVQSPMREIIIRVAAMMVLLMGLGYVGYRMMGGQESTPVVIYSDSQIIEKSLPDSTAVVINRHSKLSYIFNDEKRRVELTGEAFFDIAPDPARPLEVHAGTLMIQDIGTAFNVYAPGENDTVRVSVTDGEVLLTTRNNKTITLKKGEQALYLKLRDEFIRETLSDTNAFSYKTKIFVFENASLQVIAEKLTNVYGINISLEGEITNCHLTATFRNESIETTLEIIAETLKLELSRNEYGFTLKGSRCEE